MPPDTAFYGGAVGYLAYDYVRQLEEIPALRPDLLHLPDAWWIIPRSLIIFDHVTREIMLVVLASTAEEDGYHRAAAKIEELRIVLLKSRPGPPERFKPPGPAGVALPLRARSLCKLYKKPGIIFFPVRFFKSSSRNGWAFLMTATPLPITGC